MSEHASHKVTLSQLKTMAANGEKAVFLTAYDFPSAFFAQQAGVDMILVGDSGGMAALGYETTMPVTMDEMLMMAKAVTRGAVRPFVVGDMPYMSYQPSDELAVKNAGRFMAEAHCDAVKCEGGRRMVPRVRAMVDAGVPVMGHIGLTPQNMAQLGGYKVQGKTLDSYHELLEDALALQEAGVFSILFEAIPNEVAGKIREQLDIPVYGIGAGRMLDGQLVILHDMLGMFVGDIRPKFVKRYADLESIITDAIGQYAEDVRSGAFPAEEHFYEVPAKALKEILNADAANGNGKTARKNNPGGAGLKR